MYAIRGVELKITYNFRFVAIHHILCIVGYIAIIC